MNTTEMLNPIRFYERELTGKYVKVSETFHYLKENNQTLFFADFVRMTIDEFPLIDPSTIRMFLDLPQLSANLIEKIETGKVTLGYLKRMAKVAPNLRVVAEYELASREFTYAQFCAFCEKLPHFCFVQNETVPDDHMVLAQYFVHGHAFNFDPNGYYEIVISNTAPRGKAELIKEIARLFDGSSGIFFPSMAHEFLDGLINGSPFTRENLIWLRGELINHELASLDQ